jgi:DNA-binding response OmpR family regulator
MQSTSLAGRSILIAEDEPLIALGIADAFTNAGARVVQVRSVKAALVAVEDPTISAAIIDHALSDGDSSTLCERMS